MVPSVNAFLSSSCRRRRLSLEDHLSGKTCNSEDTPVFLVLVKTHMSRHVVVASILAAPLLTDGQLGPGTVRTMTVGPGTREDIACRFVERGRVQASVVSPATSSFTPFSITFLVSMTSPSRMFWRESWCARWQTALTVKTSGKHSLLPRYASVVLWRARQIRWWNVSR